ncbi:unnamed protein product, partial [Tenebrio molitor]
SQCFSHLKILTSPIPQKSFLELHWLCTGGAFKFREENTSSFFYVTIYYYKQIVYHNIKIFP